MAKIEIFPLCTGHSCTTLWVKNSLEIPLSVTVFEILTLFHFPQKSKIAAESGPPPPPLCTGDSCATLWIKDSLEIALCLMVFDILTLFHFPQKSKMAAENGENLNFPPLHRRLYTRNRSIFYGFRDIDRFPFSAKVKDGCRKWRKLKFFPFAQSKILSKSVYLLWFEKNWLSTILLEIIRIYSF